jgi:hypothetical protein
MHEATMTDQEHATALQATADAFNRAARAAAADGLTVELRLNGTAPVVVDIRVSRRICGEWKGDIA